MPLITFPKKAKAAPVQGIAHPQGLKKGVYAIQKLHRQRQIKPRHACEKPGSVPSVTTPKPGETLHSTYLVVLPDFKPLKKSKLWKHKQLSAKTDNAHPFQPGWRVLAVILVLASTIWKPWLLPALSLGLIMISVTIYLSYGPERLTAGITAWHGKVQARNPTRAALHRARANQISARLERIAGYLPDRWTRRLHFPIFEAKRSAEETTKNPFARLVPQERL